MKKNKFSMKKRLTLGKRTVSNLSEAEMNLLGGYWTIRRCHYPHKSNGCSKNGNSCPGHNTCQDTCV